jgi:hypothetical protein|tara:strand:+ start:291 stop:407 length:117 start_codon:yes stop_codon:yes gene_type:complete
MKDNMKDNMKDSSDNTMADMINMLFCLLPPAWVEAGPR